LLGEELSPRAAAASPGRRPEAAADQQFSDRRGRNLDPELLELALDALVAPSRVLFRKAQVSS